MAVNKTIGRNRNTTDTATSSPVALNSSTAVKLADANPNRIFFNVTINGGSSDERIFIKLQAASIDNVKTGIWIGRSLDEDGSYFKVDWEMSPDNIYTGEISAIMDSGSHTVHFTEY